MSDDPEPAENISGGTAGGGYADTFDADTPATRAEAVVDSLGDLYWQKSYGGRNAFECLVRTILSQNTSDVASQPAHDALMDRYAEARSASNGASGERSEPRSGGAGDLAEALAAADQVELAETISSAGLYNQKSERIIDIADRIVTEYGGEDEFDAFVREDDPGAVRDALLEMTGVGPKTADCVLLFAGGRDGVFPVDTHVHRITRRLGLAPPDADHEGVREHLERDVPGEKCGFGHTAMIQFGREYCSARTPACLDDPDACPMADLCDQVGVDPETGEVTDPADVGIADD
ncbi:endonuclease III [Halorientalis sp. IM1011]|uniref:endonuclease III domain-containing protein n=1 Tax=Halorientalis sp. IM1011 TaxID=1932360 RepID=UPI00097CC106|nr:endonuclease III [Halorientalis sp. IM1011]AQL41918.1 endonuclease III [Halorientalis sp. IM1011]